MSQEKPILPFESPVVPEMLKLNDKIRFNCYKGISCFNACCKQADITLAPFDIIRLKQRLGMSSEEFLAKHAVPFQMDATGLPGLKLRTEDERPVCLFVTDEGCSVYEDRPSACRYYPVGLLTMRASDSPTEEHHYAMVREDHCKGHEESRTLTIAEYRKEQDVEIYDEMNREWYQLILKKKSGGPAVGKPSEMSFQLFFMCSYDIDRFRRFVQSDSFKKVYDLPESDHAGFGDDVTLMKFGFRLLKQVLFGEFTIPVKEGAYEQRLAERQEVIEMKRQAEAEQEKKKDVFNNPDLLDKFYG